LINTLLKGEDLCLKAGSYEAEALAGAQFDADKSDEHVAEF
jgi:hypothetical protein